MVCEVLAEGLYRSKDIPRPSMSHTKNDLSAVR
jgi:hypothetical protein